MITMTFTKSNWRVNKDSINLSIPIQKIDEERRLVSGFATLDNIDQADDVVTAEGSLDAFSRFRGNIREMHMPIAAGRMVDFKPEEFYHEGSFYNGIYVTVYVSKGAPDTWEKVLDGTLSGFSIGGNVVEQHKEFVPDAGPEGKVINFITKYDLVELSLVDNPCNQLANVFSVQKSDSGLEFVKGAVMGTSEIKNVFWCPTDEIGKVSESESQDCLHCGQVMKHIDWFESAGSDTEQVGEIIAKFLRDDSRTDATSEGGVVEMENEITKSEEVAEVADEAVADEVVTEEASTDEVVEAEESADEVADEAADEQPVEVDEDPDFEKMFDSLKNAVNKSIEESRESVEKAIDEKVETLTKSFESKTEELEKSLTALGEQFEQVKSERAEVAKRLEALEAATAIKKSGEVESKSEKKVQKGLWSGTFFDA